MSATITARPTSIEIDGREFFATPCTIKSTMLGIEGHGIMTCSLHLEWPGSGVSIGGYSLDGPISDANGRFLHRQGSAYGAEYIRQVLATVGVETWEKLPGQRVQVLFATANSWGSTAKGITSFDLSRAFLPEQLAAEMGAA